MIHKMLDDIKKYLLVPFILCLFDFFFDAIFRSDLDNDLVQEMEDFLVENGNRSGTRSY